MTVEYATYQGERVQVLSRFSARADCRACGGDGYVETGRCQYCDDGKEHKPSDWAKVGMLEGPDRGHTREVRAGALREVTT